MQKHYDFNETEKRIQDFWENENIYRYIPDGRATYSIDTPPPTVSGSLHIGHIFSYAQAEMIARFQRMQGKNVFYPFGFDDNGLPTERLVEKEKGIRAYNMPRSEFTAICRETAAQYVGEFRSLWKSMGFSVDWSLQYESISPLAQKISQRLFIELAKSGRAYLKESPVLWCTNCRTSIAQAELDPAERESTFNYIPFACGGDILPVATTRPELLYGCVALFVNPHDSRYSRFIGGKATVPLYGFEIPILQDEKADMEKGTGIVMCATFGDATDLEWCQKHDLKYKKVLEKDGKVAEKVPFLAGLGIKEARNKIIALLGEKGLLIKSEKITHTVAVHERCGKDIEIIPSKQWFIDILSHKEEFLKAADEINWYPESMKTRYQLWVENLKWDWCISRQRYFGVPFPVWYCKKCGKAIFPDDCDLPVNPLEDMPKKACSCGSHDFLPETAVMDTWATSSVSPMINAHYGESDERPILPMSMRTQAHEIIRTWAFYTIVRSLYHTGKLPWKDIMICGFVMAKKGEKISKSKGNSVFEPHEMIERYSADALRYWAAGSKLGTDTVFSQDELKISGRFLTKLWNASRFAIMNLENYRDEKPDQLLPTDRWILARCGQVMKEASAFLNQYETGSARKLIDELFWRDFCDNYLELIKGRLSGEDENGRQSARYALYHSLLCILKLYAIYTPHITEEIYQNFFKQFEAEKSIHLALWNQSKESNLDSGRLNEFGDCLKSIISEVRKYKTENNLSLGAPIGKIEIGIPDGMTEIIEHTKNDIQNCCRAEGICFMSGEFGVRVLA